MPAFSRITVFFGSTCLASWWRSVSMSCTAACQTQAVRLKQLAFISDINRAELSKTRTWLIPKGSCFPAHVSRNSSMSSPMSQKMVWVDLEVSHCFKCWVIVFSYYRWKRENSFMHRSVSMTLMSRVYYMCCIVSINLLLST